MAVEGGGPNIIDDGLVFALDAANIRSYPGNATTNLSYNNGQGNSEYLANSVAWTNSGTWTLNTNNTSIDKPTILDIPNLPTLPTTLRVISGVTDSVGSQHHGCAWTNISPSTTYTMSVWFRQNRAGNSGPYLRTNVNNNQIGTFSYNGSTDTNTWPVNTWIRITATGTTQANENAIYLSNYIGSQVGDAVYYYGHQTEVGSTATPLVAGTRSAAWNALVGSSNATPVNGPVYDSSGGGNISFDGTNDYVDFSVGTLGGTVSVEMWVKLGSGYAGRMFFGWLYYDVWCSSGHLGYNTGNGDVYGITSTQVSNLGLVNNWKHYIFEMRSDVAYTNNKIYVNGEAQSLSQVQSSEASANRNFNSGNGRISSWRGSGDYIIPMNCAVFNVYNKALSQTEILQNFNAQRKRFGV